MASRPPEVTLEPVSAAVRSRCVALAVADDQRRFVAPVARYLAMCEAEGVWTPLAVCRGGEVVGFAMWAYDAGEESHWIGGLLVDHVRQREGIGRAAAARLVEQLAARPGCRGVALSYDADNAAARRLYASLGFRETGERTDDGELVARLPVPPRGSSPRRSEGRSGGVS
jgi:diamine N-acetyltransferase